MIEREKLREIAQREY